MEKVVIFDWGGIVESHENNYQELRDGQMRAVKRFNNTLSEQEIKNRWTETNEDGISMQTINDPEEIKEWERFVQQKEEINVPFEEFEKAYYEELTSIKRYTDVVDYAHSLKGRCKVAILSNLIALDKRRIDDQYDLSKFDRVFLSFELGVRKPDRTIYEYVTRDLNVSPDNILFIDDEPENIRIAKEHGWKTCQAFGYELDRIKESVESFLSQESYE